MQYYNEAKAEKKIRRQAMLLTVFFMLIATCGTVLVVSEEAQQSLPDTVKEWFNVDQEKEVPQPKKREDRA